MAARAPLGDVLVVSLEQAVAAPLCTARLADAGARVIKIERPDGDFARRYDGAARGQSSYFVWLNRGKQSMTLDLKQTQDATCLMHMIGDADIFVENLAPGAAARLGFAPRELRRRFPRLITCSISGYGAGPWSGRKAYDLLVQAESGIASVTGTESEASRVGISLVDITCGLNAWGAILEALHARARTGEGASIETSLFDGAADLMSVPLLQYEGSGQLPPRLGLHHASIAPYGAYRCGDGQQVLFAVQNEREWQRFCIEVIGDDSLATDTRFAGNTARVAHRPELDRAVQHAVLQLAGAEFTARLERSDIAWAVVHDVAGLARRPALSRATTTTDAGPVSLPISPIRIDGQIRELGAVPTLGQHSASLQDEFNRT